MVAAMGMIDRGAALDWLSQYPDECEILLPPLTAIEMLEGSDVHADDLLHPHGQRDHSNHMHSHGPSARVKQKRAALSEMLRSTKIHCLRVRINCNMHSLTLEKLLAV